MRVRGALRRAVRRLPSRERRALLALFTLVLLVGAGWRTARWLLPPPGPFAQLTFSRAFLDTKGRLLRLTVAGDGRYRLWTPLAKIAPALVEATLAKEDRRFRAHPGIDPVAIARAALGAVRGGARSGASTISMQLARVVWRLDTRKPLGKIGQMLRALALEAAWSKDEILEAYLNLAPYGGNVEGAGAAAWIYFGKPAAELSRAESLRLALVPQSPTRRGADLARAVADAPNPPPVTDRAVLDLAHAVVADPAAAAALARDALRLTTKPRASLPWRAPHLVDRLRAELPKPAAREDGAVRTTLDASLQDLVERQVTLHLAALARVGIHNAVALLVHRPTRAVRAYVGSAAFADRTIDGQVDGIRARRSPGSTLKPLLYALAMDEGLIHPASMLLDVPSAYGVYDPENFDRNFLGPIDATTALVASRNVPAIELLSRVKPDVFESFLRDAGVRFPFPAPGAPGRSTAPIPGLTLALGGSEVSMEELAVLYAALGDGGRAAPLRYLAKPLRKPRPAAAVLSPEAAFLVRTMLSDNPRPSEGAGRSRLAARASAPSVAWKTGTSFGTRDAWAVGLAGEWVVAVWLGDFRGRSNSALIGRDAAGPLLFKIIDALVAERPRETLAPFPAAPPRARRVHVCALSGGMPGPGCAVTKETWFIPGVSPTAICPIHQVVEVRAATGLRACGPGGPTVRRTFEFWPSEALRAFAHLGVPRRSPPPLEPGCTPDAAALASGGRGDGGRKDGGLEILSPRRNVIYPVQVSEGRPVDPILLTASAGSDAGRVYWFLDEALIGDTAPGEALAWAPKPGRYVVRAVDARGASDARDLLVVATR